MPTPQAERRTLAELTAALHTRGLVDPADPLDGAELLVGWESAVVRTADGWIYRFARMGRETFDRELAVLGLVDGRLGVPTPRIERTDSDELVMAYRTITGAALDLDLVLGQTPTERAPLTRSWATVLATMHDLAPDVVGAVAIPPIDLTQQTDEVRSAAWPADPGVRARLTEVLAAWEDCVLAQPSDGGLLLHGDFHPGNMVFDSATGPISGLWDFTCVERGDPAGDFRYLVGDSVDLAAEIAEHYTALTGRPVDLHAARLAGVVETLSDAVAEGRPLTASLLETV